MKRSRLALFLLCTSLCPAWAVPSSAAPFAYVANGGDDTVSVIDVTSNTVVATIPVYPSPFGVAVSPDGKRVYVSNEGSPAGLAVIDTDSRTVIATVPGAGNEGVAVSPNGAAIYVVRSSVPAFVSVVDAATYAVVATVPVGEHNLPLGIMVNPEGTRAYVTNYVNTVEAGARQPCSFSPLAFCDVTVSVIDTATNANIGAITVGDYLSGIAVSPSGTRLYVANTGFGAVPDAIADIVSAFDVSSDAPTLVAKIPRREDAATGGFGKPAALALSPNGSRLYVANPLGPVWIIDTEMNSPVGSVAVPGGTVGAISITQDGRRIYVPTAEDSVAVIDANSDTVIATIPVGKDPGGFGQFIGPGAVPTPTATPTPFPTATATPSGVAKSTGGGGCALGPQSHSNLSAALALLLPALLWLPGRVRRR